jgi:hypothetical protein
VCDTLLAYIEWPSDDAVRIVLGRAPLGAQSARANAAGGLLGVLVGALAVLEAASAMSASGGTSAVAREQTTANPGTADEYVDDVDVSTLDAAVTMPWSLAPLWTPGVCLCWCARMRCRQ